MFITAIGYIALNGYNVVNALNTLKYVSMRNQECKVKTGMVNVKSNQSLFYSYSVTVNKCSGK